MADVLFFLHKAKQIFLFSQQNLRWVRAYVLCPGKRRREKAVVINAALLGSLVALEPFWWSKIVSIVKSSFHFYCKPLFSPSHCHRVTVSVGSSSNTTKTGVKFLHHRGRSKLPFPLAPSSTSPSNHHFSMYISSRERCVMSVPARASAQLRLCCLNSDLQRKHVMWPNTAPYMFQIFRIAAVPALPPRWWSCIYIYLIFGTTNSYIIKRLQVQASLHQRASSYYFFLPSLSVCETRIM